MRLAQGVPPDEGGHGDRGLPSHGQHRAQHGAAGTHDITSAGPG